MSKPPKTRRGSRSFSVSAHGLPKSNHSRRVAISQAKAFAGVSVDRRAIPADAQESRWTAPDGHEIRRIDLPQDETRGSILFLGGRGDFYEKYLEALVHWQSRGWRVTAADWRGQAGSGRLGIDAVTGHIEDFAVWVADLAALWAQWSAETPGPHVLAGHSMGAHLALRATAERAVQPDGLVLVAPMLGLAGRLPTGVTHALARVMLSLGDARRPAWKWSEKPGEPPASREHLLTHDPARYADELYWRQQRPDLVMGPGSWGWVERASASMRSLLRPGVLEAVAVPTLMLAAREDKLVAFRAIADAAARLPNVELVTFGPEARHEILRESDAVRTQAMTSIDAFLDRISG